MMSAANLGLVTLHSTDDFDLDDFDIAVVGVNYHHCAVRTDESSPVVWSRGWWKIFFLHAGVTTLWKKFLSDTCMTLTELFTVVSLSNDRVKSSLITTPT